MLLFEDVVEVFGEEAAQLMPYVQFEDEDGPHNIQLREWGCYEWLRKEPERANQLWSNLKFDDPGHDHYFVVGNMNNRRNVWLVISTYRVKKEATLFGDA
jgi:hypothetical protein